MLFKCFDYKGLNESANHYGTAVEPPLFEAAVHLVSNFL